MPFLLKPTVCLILHYHFALREAARLEVADDSRRKGSLSVSTRPRSLHRFTHAVAKVISLFSIIGMMIVGGNLVSAASSTSGWSPGLAIDPPHTGATSVSCPTATFCVAVDSDGNALTYNGTAWSVPLRVDADGSPLNSVSCSSSSFCAAVDNNGRAYMFNGTSWSSPGIIDPHGYMRSVSCASASFCVAADTYGYVLTWSGTTWSDPVLIDSYDAGGTRYVSCPSTSFCALVNSGNAFTFNGSTWSGPTAIDEHGFLDAISCSSSTFCAAEDLYGDALTFNGSSWSNPISVESDMVDPPSLSCLSSDLCIGVDDYGNTVSYNGSVWSAPINIAGVYGLDSVSCPSASSCTAVGNQFVALSGSSWSTPALFDSLGGGPLAISCASASFCAASTPGVDALTYNGSTWNYSANVVPDSYVTQTSISCPTSSFCALAASDGDVVTYNGASWSTPIKVDQGGGLMSISCASASFCVAVDDAGNFVELNGATWTLPTTIDSSGEGLVSVSCPTSGFCVAVDYAGNALAFNGTSWTSPQSLGTGSMTSVSCSSSSFCVAISTGDAVTFNGTTWSAGVLVDSPNSLFAVSCASSSFCDAVDNSGNVTTFNGTSWSAPLAIDSGTHLISISCPSTLACVAGDNDGNVFNFLSNSVALKTPTSPTISNLPQKGSHGSGFTAVVQTTGDGLKTVSASTPSSCTVVGGLKVVYAGPGTCTLTASVAAGSAYGALSGTTQSFQIVKAMPTRPQIANLPSSGTVGSHFVATVRTTGDGVKTIVSNSPRICKTSGGLRVTFLKAGTCSLTAGVGAGADFISGRGLPQRLNVKRR